MTRTDLANLCSHVSDFAHINQWRREACPVIAFEFTSMSDYFAAKTSLARMIMDEPHYAISSALQKRFERVISSDTCELDCYGVTFRLICKSKIDTEYGARGVNDVNVIVQTLPPPPWLDKDRTK